MKHCEHFDPTPYFRMTPPFGRLLPREISHRSWTMTSGSQLWLPDVPFAYVNSTWGTAWHNTYKVQGIHSQHWKKASPVAMALSGKYQTRTHPCYCATRTRPGDRHLAFEGGRFSRYRTMEIGNSYRSPWSSAFGKSSYSDWLLCSKISHSGWPDHWWRSG